jgi:hypothetical protein
MFVCMCMFDNVRVLICVRINLIVCVYESV